jgi:hypothetical protein
LFIHTIFFLVSLSYKTSRERKNTNTRVCMTN